MFLRSALVLGLLSAAACKTGASGGNASVKDIESIKKVSLVQGNDASGNAVAFITCAEGFIDKQAKKADFAVPWNKVVNLSYGELEKIYCTEPEGGSIVVGPGGAPGGTSGGATGDFTALDTLQCKQAEGVDLPNIAEVKRVNVPASVTDTYDRCVMFGFEFERMLTKLTIIKKALVDKKVRVFAVNEDKFAYDDAAKKLTVPLQIKDKLDKLLEAVLPILGGSALKTKTFPSNKGLIFNVKAGGACFNDAVAYCKSLGEPWVLPTTQQLATVAPDLNGSVIGQLTANTNGNYTYIWVKVDGNTNAYAIPPFSGGGANYSQCDMSCFCVLDATN